MRTLLPTGTALDLVDEIAGTLIDTECGVILRAADLWPSRDTNFRPK